MRVNAKTLMPFVLYADADGCGVFVSGEANEMNSSPSMCDGEPTATVHVFYESAPKVTKRVYLCATHAHEVSASVVMTDEDTQDLASRRHNTALALAGKAYVRPKPVSG